MGDGEDAVSVLRILALSRARFRFGELVAVEASTDSLDGPFLADLEGVCVRVTWVLNFVGVEGAKMGVGDVDAVAVIDIGISAEAGGLI